MGTFLWERAMSFAGRIAIFLDIPTWQCTTVGGAFGKLFGHHTFLENLRRILSMIQPRKKKAL